MKISHRNRWKSRGRWTRLTSVAVVALVGTALVSCSSNDDAASSSSSSGGGAFPVTIDHAFGSTTIDSEPQRIVTVGYNDEQALLALGIKPVGMVNQYPGEPDVNRTWPWVTGPWGGTEPTVVGSNPETTISVEKIAALEPDLILALYSSIDKDLYSTLSAIAPTVAKDPAYATTQLRGRSRRRPQRRQWVAKPTARSWSPISTSSSPTPEALTRNLQTRPR